jgi:sugar O-acyltransferase (sialic acid O-acetyltransferase NeuD family)
MKIVIAGAGGFGREVLALIRNINQIKSTFEVLGFVDDGFAVGTKVHELSVIGDVSMVEQTGAEGAVVAIGKTQLREEVVSRMPSGLKFPNIIHPLAVFQDTERIQMGQGNIICAGNIFTTDIRLGNFCIINLACTIGHDATINDFCSIMPGVNISGGALLKRGVYVGTGGKLIKATTLGNYCIVGAGAVVDSEVEPNQTVVGVPARVIKPKS